MAPRVRCHCFALLPACSIQLMSVTGIHACTPMCADAAAGQPVSASGRPTCGCWLLLSVPSTPQIGGLCCWVQTSLQPTGAAWEPSCAWRAGRDCLAAGVNQGSCLAGTPAASAQLAKQARLLGGLQMRHNTPQRWLGCLHHRSSPATYCTVKENDKRCWQAKLAADGMGHEHCHEPDGVDGSEAPSSALTPSS